MGVGVGEGVGEGEREVLRERPRRGREDRGSDATMTPLKATSSCWSRAIGRREGWRGE